MVHGILLFFGLFNNLAIFIVLIAVYSSINSAVKRERDLLRQLLVGVSFGALAIICMQVKIPVFEGVVVDQRNAVVILSGAFGGPFAGGISALFAGLYRIKLGGAGVIGGLTGLALSTVAGSLIHYNRSKITTVWQAAVVSLATAVFILPGFLPIKDLQTGFNLMLEMALPYGSAVFIGVFVTGLILVREEYRHIMKCELKDSEERYRDLFESLIDVSMRTDAENRIAIISPSCIGMFGYSPQELIGRYVRDFYRIPDGGQLPMDAFGADGIMENYEAQILRKDGDSVWVSINAKILRDRQGGYAGFEANVRDISQIRKALEEKTQLQERLRQMQKMESVGRLAGGIAHDFNNSLSGIIGSVELLRDENITDEQRRYYENIILSAADRAGELTRKLLAFSRKGTAVFTPVDIASVIRDSVVILQRTLDKQITVEAHFRTDDRWVSGDDALLQNVFINLGINAGHAMPQGGTLSIVVRETELSEEYCDMVPFDIAAGWFLQISVSDTGCGIPPEVLPKIFEPFFTTKEIGKGTGLGLASVYGTMHEHHGAITVYSEVGKGTVFHLYLPMSAREKGGVAEDESALPCGSGTILLVDDEALVRDTAAALLKRQGYEVLLAEDGAKALQMYTEHRAEIRLVILDLIMPVMGGKETFQYLHEADPRLPVIVTTGFSRETDIQMIREMGAVDILAKPFRRREIAEKVARYCI